MSGRYARRARLSNPLGPVSSLTHFWPLGAVVSPVNTSRVNCTYQFEEKNEPR